jgi:hypothetical protein
MDLWNDPLKGNPFKDLNICNFFFVTQQDKDRNFLKYFMKNPSN